VADVVVVEVPATAEVVEVATGVPGIQGPKGDPGDGIAFEYTQASPLATWTITVPATFGRRPNIAVYTESGEHVLTDISSNSTTATITFASPTTGSAVLS
jgi:hypothetical protein